MEKNIVEEQTSSAPLEVNWRHLFLGACVVVIALMCTWAALNSGEAWEMFNRWARMSTVPPYLQ